MNERRVLMQDADRLGTGQPNPEQRNAARPSLRQLSSEWLAFAQPDIDIWESPAPKIPEFDVEEFHERMLREYGELRPTLTQEAQNPVRPRRKIPARHLGTACGVGGRARRRLPARRRRSPRSPPPPTQPPAHVSQVIEAVGITDAVLRIPLPRQRVVRGVLSGETHVDAGRQDGGTPRSVPGRATQRPKTLRVFARGLPQYRAAGNRAPGFNTGRNLFGSWSDAKMRAAERLEARGAAPSKPKGAPSKSKGANT